MFSTLLINLLIAVFNLVFHLFIKVLSNSFKANAFLQCGQRLNAPTITKITPTITKIKTKGG